MSLRLKIRNDSQELDKMITEAKNNYITQKDTIENIKIAFDKAYNEMITLQLKSKINLNKTLNKIHQEHNTLKFSVFMVTPSSRRPIAFFPGFIIIAETIPIMEAKREVKT